MASFNLPSLTRQAGSLKEQAAGDLRACLSVMSFSVRLQPACEPLLYRLYFQVNKTFSQWCPSTGRSRKERAILLNWRCFDVSVSWKRRATKGNTTDKNTVT